MPDTALYVGEVMSPSAGRLSQLPEMQSCPKLDRSLLRDQAADTLRTFISTGRIPEGTRLTEREVSQLLGISRMPAREALQVLEAEGLIIRRAHGRHVIVLDEASVRSLHEVRWTLERLAAERAAANRTPAHCAELYARLDDLGAAIAAGDPARCTRCDLAIHRAIWRQAANPYLLSVLESLLGVIYVLAERVKVYGRGDSDVYLEQHRTLISLIAAGDAAGAGAAVAAQLQRALQASLRTFRVSDVAEAPPHGGAPSG
jgi:DNA-binding GntR family transcriptional regulator